MEKCRTKATTYDLTEPELFKIFDDEIIAEFGEPSHNQPLDYNYNAQNVSYKLGKDYN